MTLGQRIEDGLRQRPSDERVYSQPLTVLANLKEVEPVTNVRPKRRVAHRSAAPALAAFCALLALAGGALFIAAVGPWRGANTGGSPQASGSPQVSGSPGASGAPVARTTPQVSGSPQLGSSIQLSASVASIALTGRIGCSWGGGSFTEAELTAAFTSPSANADTEETAAAAALRSRLASTEDPLPKTGWVVLSETSTEATFLTIGRPGYELWVATFTNETPTAGWQWTGWGQCFPGAVPPDGYERARWSVDPSVPVTPTATDLHILVAFGSCRDQPISGGEVAVNATRVGSIVTITAFDRTPVGTRTCSDLPPSVPAIIHLDQSLGDLTLLDGGHYPVARVATNDQPTATYFAYKVKSGDTFVAIAARFYLTLWELGRVNPQVADPNHLEVGQTLAIPPAGLATQPPASPSGG